MVCPPNEHIIIFASNVFVEALPYLFFFGTCANRFRLVDFAGVEPLRKLLRQKLVPGDGKIKNLGKCQITEETPQMYDYYCRLTSSPTQNQPTQEAVALKSACWTCSRSGTFSSRPPIFAENYIDDDITIASIGVEILIARSLSASQNYRNLEYLPRSEQFNGGDFPSHPRISAFWKLSYIREKD